MKSFDYVAVFEDGYEEVCSLLAHDEEEAVQYVKDVLECLKYDGVIDTHLIDILEYYKD